MRQLNEYASGSFTGSASVTTTIVCGFKPACIRIVEDKTSGVSGQLQWQEGMASPSALKSADHATAQFTLITTGQAISVNSQGFSLLAGNTHTFYWIAF